MFSAFTGLIQHELTALRDEIDDVRGQLREIAEWLGIPPIDLGLGVATIAGVLATIF